jgi:hypothetical protein
MQHVSLSSHFFYTLICSLFQSAQNIDFHRYLQHVSLVPFFLYIDSQFIPKCANTGIFHETGRSWFPVIFYTLIHDLFVWLAPADWFCNFALRVIFLKRIRTIFCLEAISRSRSCKSIAQTTRLHQSRGNSILPRKKLHQPIGHIPASSYSIRSRYCFIRLVRRQTHEVVVFVLVSHIPFGFKLDCSITKACVEGGLHVCSCNAFAGDPEDERWEKWYTKSKFSVFFFRTLLDLSTQQMTTTVAIQVSENT